VQRLLFPLRVTRTELFHTLLFRGRALSVLSAALLAAHPPALSSQNDSVSALREKIDQAEKERMEICKILGAIYEETGDTEKAIESYRMGFQVYPDDPFFCNKLIRLYTARERWAELVPIYESLVNANPGANKKHLNDLAVCLLKAGQPEEAVGVIAEMLEEYGEDAAIYRDAAQTFMKHEHYEGAATVCQQGIEGEFAEQYELHWILGRATGKLKRYTEAVSAYEKALQLCRSARNKEIIEKELAELCAEEPIIEQILQDKIESLKTIDQRLAELYWQKALDKQEAGDLDEASSLYRRIILLVPNSERGKAAQLKIQQLPTP